MSIQYRSEHDSVGERSVPKDVYYGVQSLRAAENFPITGLAVHPEQINSIAEIKKASAITNLEIGLLDKRVADAIVRACDEIAAGRLHEAFIVDPIQGGAGTSLNMNANEVIANRAIELLGGEKGDYSLVNPNDHVNYGQSTNDVFPSAGKLAVLKLLVRAQIQLERMQLELETAKNNLSLYRKAENREELQKEYDRVAAILEKLRSQQDQLAGRGSPVKQGRLGDSLGQSKDKPLYYQWLEDTRTKEYYLTDDIIRNDILPKSRNSAYVVLVTRAGNVNNGAITCYGMYIVAEDTETPVKLKVMNDLPAYQDGYVTPSTAEIKDREEQLATIETLLNESLTKEELKSLIATTEKQVYDGQRSVKQAQIGLDKKKKELGDGTVYSEIDGVVKAVRPADEAYNNSEAVVEVSGGGGYYITGTLGELDLGKVKLGDTVDISSWMTGASCQGEIVEISDFPTDNRSNWGDGNSNVSYYPFKVFVSEDANLQPGDYVDMSYQKTVTTDGNTIYLQTMFIRTENGKSYVMARGDNGRLEKRWVQTGRDLWGSYTQIRGGLSLEDYVAFPYGKDVREGAATVEANADELYNGL